MSWTEVAGQGRILVVDDAMENIHVLHAALRDEHDVLFAMDGPRAHTQKGLVKALADIFNLHALLNILFFTSQPG